MAYQEWGKFSICVERLPRQVTRFQTLCLRVLHPLRDDYTYEELEEAVEQIEHAAFEGEFGEPRSLYFEIIYCPTLLSVLKDRPRYFFVSQKQLNEFYDYKNEVPATFCCMATPLLDFRRIEAITKYSLWYIGVKQYVYRMAKHIIFAGDFGEFRGKPTALHYFFDFYYECKSFHPSVPTTYQIDTAIYQNLMRDLPMLSKLSWEGLKFETVHMQFLAELIKRKFPVDVIRFLMHYIEKEKF